MLLQSIIEFELNVVGSFHQLGNLRDSLSIQNGNIVCQYDAEELHHYVEGKSKQTETHSNIQAGEQHPLEWPLQLGSLNVVLFGHHSRADYRQQILYSISFKCCHLVQGV